MIGVYYIGMMIEREAAVKKRRVNLFLDDISGPEVLRGGVL